MEPGIQVNYDQLTEIHELLFKGRFFTLPFQKIAISIENDLETYIEQLLAINPDLNSPRVYFSGLRDAENFIVNTAYFIWQNLTIWEFFRFKVHIILPSSSTINFSIPITRIFQNNKFMMFTRDKKHIQYEALQYVLRRIGVALAVNNRHVIDPSIITHLITRISLRSSFTQPTILNSLFNEQVYIISDSKRVSRLTEEEIIFKSGEKYQLGDEVHISTEAHADGIGAGLLHQIFVRDANIGLVQSKYDNAMKIHSVLDIVHQSTDILSTQ